MTHNCSSQLAAGEEETKFSAPLVAAQTSTVYTGLLGVPTRRQQLIFHADSMSPEMSHPLATLFAKACPRATTSGTRSQLAP